MKRIRGKSDYIDSIAARRSMKAKLCEEERQPSGDEGGIPLND